MRKTFSEFGGSEKRTKRKISNLLETVVLMSYPKIINNNLLLLAPPESKSGFLSVFILFFCLFKDTAVPDVNLMLKQGRRNVNV